MTGNESIAQRNENRTLEENRAAASSAAFFSTTMPSVDFSVRLWESRYQVTFKDSPELQDEEC